MIKKSNRSFERTESRRQVRDGGKRIGEWAYEGGRTEDDLAVAIDGERTRYQGELHFVQRVDAWRQYGWYRRM